MDSDNRKKVRAASSASAPKRKEPQLSNDELRKRKKQIRMRKKRIRKLVLTVAAVITAVAVSIILMIAFLFTIKTINVKGETRYTDAMIIEKSGISEGDALYLINNKKVKAAVEEGLPYIKELVIKKSFPNEITLTVKSAKEVATISAGGSYIVIDKDCKVLNENLSMLSESDVVVSGISVKEAEAGQILKVKKPERIKALSAVLGAVEDCGLKRVTAVNVKDVKNIKVIYDNRITLHIGSVDDIENKIGRAKAVIKEENEKNPHVTGEVELKDDTRVIFRETHEEKKKEDKSGKTDAANKKENKKTN